MSPAATDPAGEAVDHEEGELGQAATELALVLPLLTLLLLAVVQVTLVARDQILVVHAARAAARQAAVDPRPASVEQEARLATASSLKSARLRVETSPIGGGHQLVTVTVHYRAPTDVPLVGPLLPDVELRANAAMRGELRAARGKDANEKQQHHGRNRPPRSRIPRGVTK
jgi:Flp pilus assembly protein TadG